MKVVTYKKIMKLDSCYDPQEIGMPVDYRDTVVNFLNEYKDKVKYDIDIFWVVRNYMELRGLQEFALFCANQVRHLMKDKRSIDALDVARKYLDGKASIEDLEIAFDAARDAATAAYYAASDAATYYAATYYAAYSAVDAVYSAFDAARDAASDAARAAAFAARDAASTARDAAAFAARAAAYNKTMDAQINWLINYFENFKI